LIQILHYNIFNGFGGEEDRIAAFVDYLADHSYDLLALNEYRIEDHRMRQRLEKIGYSHGIVNTTARAANRSAFFSRRPFKPIFADADFRLVQIEIDGLELVNYHASPHGVEAVLQEADRWLSTLKESRNLAVMGDFNSLSWRDEAKFRYDHPAQAIAARYLRGGKVSYDFIRRLEANGLADLDDGHSPDNWSIPTAIARPGEVDWRARIDYAFARLDEHHTGSSRVLKEPFFDLLSDHYPVAVSINRSVHV